MGAIKDRRGSTEPAGGGRQGNDKRARSEFALRQRELQAVLGEVHEALRRGGLARGKQFDTSEPAAVEAAPLVDEQDVFGQRAQVRDVAAAMFSRLETRLARLSRIFGQLSDGERVTLAALLRLPESRRAVIATMLRLPEQEREELSIGFRLSDTECRALADLLHARRAAPEAKPKIRIVDAAVADEGEASLPDKAR